jgi:predicted phage terminase large subunit-like protein
VDDLAELIASGAGHTILDQLEQMADDELRKQCAGSLYAFVQEFWDVVEPGRPFVHGWHLEWLCKELEAITDGVTIRALFNVPPGAMKSLLVSVFWPAYEWGPRNMPSMRYLLAAYTQTLTLRDNRRAKMIMNSPKYRRLWPDVQIDPRRTSDENFANTSTGWRIATSPGGLGTGERADRIIIDDPHSVKTADSDAVREETLRWWREVIPTRVNDPQTSAIIVIMQRVHEGDVSGDILDNRNEGWVHVMIPMRYEPDRHCVTDHGEDPRTEDGELYWPERFPDWTVVRDSVPLGRFGVAAQFQQIPSPKGGGIIARETWQMWPPEDDADRWMHEVQTEDGGTRLVMRFPPWETVIAYLDTAFTEKEENAWCALVRLGVFADSAGRPKVMLAGAWQERPTLRELSRKVLDTCRRGNVDWLVIENRAGAEWVKQELQRLMRDGEFAIVLDEPRGDKVARLHSVSPLFEDGVIYAPDRDWADMVITQVAQFPKGRFKDLVDCVSGGLGYLRRSGLIKLSVEHDEDERESRVFRGNRESVAERYGVG